MSYAAPTDLRNVAAIYGVLVGSDDEAQRALDLASHDLDLALIGTGAVNVAALIPTQVDALADATAIQACFRIQQGSDVQLGVDDGLASAGGVTFSMRTPARLSPEAADRIAGVGLLKRSGCAPPPPEPFWPHRPWSWPY